MKIEKHHQKKAFLISGFLAVSLLLAVVVNFTWGRIPAEVEEGRIAKQNLRADRDYDIIDEEETSKVRQKAIEEVDPVFDWDEDISHDKIVENEDELKPYEKSGILLRAVRKNNQPAEEVNDFRIFITLEEARLSTLKKKLDHDLPKEEVRANVFYNAEETEALKRKAYESVSPIIIPVSAGESVFRLGDKITSRHVKIVNGIRHEKSHILEKTRFLGTFAFIFILSMTLFFVVSRNRRRFKLEPKDGIYLATLLVFILLTHRVMLFLMGVLHDALNLDIPLSSFYALVPIAAGAMMVRFVLPLPIAIAFATMSAALSGLVLQGNLSQTFYYLLSGLFGMQLMVRVRSRGQILKVGLWLGLFNFATLLSFELISAQVVGPFDIEEFLIKTMMGMVNGFFCAITILIFMPLFEVIFNYLTPIKLLEYGSLNHPILREMLVQAPGTYHHSHMVGTLAENACEAIGADSLFARVACYFHDIGKMKKSPYFIENTRTGEDRHAALSPSMSALIIVSHVKEGMDLAKSYKLPQKIIDIIPQHQGTKLISYFYNKAKEREDKDTHIVEENAYRYPGPKPQTREAGVILLADTIEAATRSLKDRSPARLEEVIRNMINKNFIDGQLDECELTLKDLHIIAKSFVRILMGIYHNRIEYPPDATDKAVAEMATGKEHADKYQQSTLLQKDSLKDAPARPGKDSFFSRH